MLPQKLAVEKIVDSLKKDSLVQAVFLKGSMGRGEHDAHSDIDLYCLVNEENKKAFLANRVKHLLAYRDIILMDDIFIVAPQIIAVFDDLLHIDFFTVTKETFVGGDYFKVLYDPQSVMDEFKGTQGLTLSDQEYRDDVLDVGWFLYQYRQSAARGNEIWSVKMLTNVVHHLGRALLYRYAPERAKLGLKTIERSLPADVVAELKEILEFITPEGHVKAAVRIGRLMDREYEWIRLQWDEDSEGMRFLRRMVDMYTLEKEEEGI
ncbi:nucleotidyltransferase domain-containing protein [Sporosarcina highlanderae]|uniref:Nucleotidyltransferase domain-containing protein n=1 Tax=Sporosarcina highlanderae TaxID=3035916 RepID=A0ABT8JM57_9BACL|nr:nucleotidyltransferase domain-containing protein [Sporosarcina highlanderae]MDN4606154.1 nucleotidyltransferase domain-containing protein [Sporosarcina highlanderae]